MGRFSAELISIIKHYHLDFRKPYWKDTLFMIEEGMYSDDYCQILLSEARLDAEIVENQGNFLWRPPDEDELFSEGKPDIELGNMIEGSQCRIGISLKTRPKNVLIIAGAGAGKTVCSRDICIQVDRLNQTQKENPTLLFIIDLKNDYTDLKNKLTGETVIYSVINNLHFGLNAPENVAPYIWAAQISLSLAGRIGIITARIVLTSIIAELLLLLNPGLEKEDLKDPSTSKHLTWPPLETVLKVTKHKKIMDVYSSKASYSQSLTETLEGLLQDSAELFNCCNGLDLNNIIQQKKHCIISAQNLPAYVTHIITDICINQVLIKRLAEGYKTDHTDIVFVLDESDLLLESDVSNFTDLSPLDRLHRLGREMGLMSIVSVSGM